MLIELAGLSVGQVYHAMIQTIIPRPIAWVLSDNGDGGCNLAPFSYFNGVCSRPPLLMISVGRKTDGSRKDTWVNIDARREFVVHIAGRELLGAVAGSAAELPHGESELTMLGLPTAAVEGFRLPRVVGPRAALFCEKYAIHEVGDGPQGLVLGEVKAVWYDDGVARVHDGRLTVDAAALDPLARLGGRSYTAGGNILTAPASAPPAR